MGIKYEKWEGIGTMVSMYYIVPIGGSTKCLSITPDKNIKLIDKGSKKDYQLTFLIKEEADRLINILGLSDRYEAEEFWVNKEYL